MQIANKKIAEMLIVCLPCHFDYGIAPVSCARGTPLAVLYDTYILTMTRAYYVQGVPRWRFSMIHIYLQ